MTFTSAPITVKDGAASDKPLIAYSDGTNSATAHPLLDNTGAIISPATAGGQTTGNTTLAAIQTAVANIPASPATAALQSTGNNSMAAIATNTAGAATAAKQDTGNTALAAIQTNTAGVATAAKQDTGNTALAAIQTSVAAIATASGTEATAALQTAGNTKLDTIITNTAGASTAANQTAANTKLDTIIANTGKGSVNLSNTPTVSTTPAYAINDVVGGKLSFTGAARVNGGSGLIQQAYVTKKTAMTAAFDLYIFNADPVNSTFTDNSPLAIATADQNKLVGVIHCADLLNMGTPKALQATGQALAFKIAANDTILFVVPVIVASLEQYASTSDVTVNLGIIQD